MKDFNRKPKYITYYLFPVDGTVAGKGVNVKNWDRSKLCLPKNNEELVSRMLEIFRHVTPETIIKDCKEMKLTGVACVGLDGTNMTVEEIKSPRYAELIKKCRKAGLMFIHGFPFADTYFNYLTNKYPHIKQMTHNGGHPYVGWDKENSHPNIDYGSDEFIQYCKECIDALKELGCEVIDYAEPDHFPWPENGYGESLAEAYKKETGGELPYPTTLKHRRFMEDRNLRGICAIGDYARSKGMSDHLTASPLIHGGTLICQNYGKYSRTKVDELSTTFHDSFGFAVSGYAREWLDMFVSPIRAHGIGCIESRSMRGWGERHAVYIGCGQAYPMEHFEESLPSTIILHQMDIFFWDYMNFRGRSMYTRNIFEDYKTKYKKFKKLVSNTIDAYMKLPQDYRNAVPFPDALVFYSKESDYLYEIEKKSDKGVLNGGMSFYSIAFKLQLADTPFMAVFDEYPEALKNDGKDTPLLVIDGYQTLSPGFANAAEKWFGQGKAVFFSGKLEGNMEILFGKLSKKINPTKDVKLSDWDIFRNEQYAESKEPDFIKAEGWKELLKIKGKAAAWVKGNKEEGMLVYTIVPFSRVYKMDIQTLCHTVLDMLGRRQDVVEGQMRREVVRYRKGNKKYLCIKNHDNATDDIQVYTKEKPKAFHLRKGATLVIKQPDDRYRLDINFKPGEIRIIEY